MMPALADSPFPGMDPFIESAIHWKDFHARFINCLSEALHDRMPQNYVARIEEDVLMLDHDEADDHLAEPDVAVIRGPGSGRRNPASGGTATLEPTTIANVTRLDPHRETFLEIRRLPDQQLVTVIELLSRSNKSGGGRGLYQEKRERLLHEPIGLVEIDLLRFGRRIDLARPLPAGHYYTFVSRAERRPWYDVFAWTIRDPMPDIPIPLAKPDGDVILPLKEAFRCAFQRGRYRRLIDYHAACPEPALDNEDAAWAATFAPAT